MTKVICERRDCQNWVDGECAKEEITVKEKTLPLEEAAVCSTYKAVTGVC